MIVTLIATPLVTAGLLWNTKALIDSVAAQSTEQAMRLFGGMIALFLTQIIVERTKDHVRETARFFFGLPCKKRSHASPKNA